MRTERSVMYKSSRKEKSGDKSTVTNKSFTKKLSNIRQHLFSRDSSSCRDDANFTGESMDLTEILEKFVTSCATLSTLSSSYHPEKEGDNLSRKTSSKESIANLADAFARNIEVQPVVTRVSKMEEGAAGGDGASVLEVSKGYGSQNANNGIEIVQKQLFKD